MECILNEELARDKSVIVDTGEAVSPAKILKPETPNRKCLFQPTLSSLERLWNYWAMHLLSHAEETFYKKVDDASIDLFQKQQE